MPSGFRCNLNNAVGVDGTLDMTYMISQNYEYSDATDSLGLYDLATSGTYSDFNGGAEFIAITFAPRQDDATTRGDDWSSNIWQYQGLTDELNPESYFSEIDNSNTISTSGFECTNNNINSFDFDFVEANTQFSFDTHWFG